MIIEIPLHQCKIIETFAFPEHLRILSSIQTWDQFSGIYQIKRKDFFVLSDGKTWFYLGVRYKHQPSEVWQFGKLPDTPTIDRAELYNKVVDLGISEIYCKMRLPSYRSFNRMKDNVHGFQITMLTDSLTNDDFPEECHIVTFSVKRV